mmetsp:Transcript_32191/g.90548  ORF Transcript_32191/g.90548 Transcript_32191/m.90548 type:complete len:631 (-) Transcript_32191:78-1970(-)
MAVILGISSGPHDSAACLICDGKLLRAAAEERFTRKKMDGRFPEASIAFCLESEGLTVEDVSVVAHGWRFGAASADVRRIAQRVAEERGLGVAKHLLYTAERFEEVDRNVEQRIYDGLARLGIPRARLRMYDHHLCHAAAALYFCPYPGATDPPAPGAQERACCVTLDGRGDFSAGKVVVVAATPAVALGGSSKAARQAPQPTEAPPEQLRTLDSTTMFDSVGFLWAFVTAALGFKPFRHEGKLTGLAARGDAKKTLPIFDSVMGLVQDEGADTQWQIRTKWHAEVLSNFQLFLVGLEGSHQEQVTIQDFKLFKDLASHSKEDVAAGLQHFTERLMIDYMERNGFSRPLVCLSGGVFANVRLNMRFRTELSNVDHVFVYPSMGDGGLCAGAAALATREFGQVVAAPQGIVFLGPEFEAGEVRAAVEALQMRNPRSIAASEEVLDTSAFARAVASHLAAGRIVGLLWGAMEFGPRSLGHRSLLAPATDPAITELLNGCLRRSDFMPFAPVTLRAKAGEAYVGWRAEDLEAGRHMTMCYEVTPEMRSLCPAVVHVDGTARPQVVDERDGLYFQVLEAYFEESGVHTLINTSFNLHEDPIVCTPANAVSAFEGGACDVLAAYPFLVTACTAIP